MEYAREHVSTCEAELLLRAETAIKGLASRYNCIVQHQIRELNLHINRKQWQDAAQIAHTIGGEAGTFNHTHAGRAAMVLRDFLSLPFPETRHDAIRAASDAVTHLVMNDVGVRDARRLLAGLKTIATKNSRGVRQ